MSRGRNQDLHKKRKKRIDEELTPAASNPAQVPTEQSQCFGGPYLSERWLPTAERTGRIFVQKRYCE